MPEDCPAQPIRVAYVVNRFATGGLERCVAHFVNGLDPKAFSTKIISLTEIHDDAKAWLSPEAPVEFFEIRKQRGNDPRTVAKLWSTLRHNADVVQSHNWATLLETAIACWRARLPQIHTEHGQQQRWSSQLRGPKGWLTRRLRVSAYKRCHQIVACAKSVQAGVASEWGLPSSEVAYIPNGTAPMKAVSPNVLREEWGIPTNATLIGSVGRLFELKGFEYLIAACEILATRSPNMYAVIVGDGPDMKRLQVLVESKGLQNRVKLVGNRSDVADCLAAFDIYANSSTTEAMSMSILEAMDAGLPIVATNVGDSGVLLKEDGVCGTLVPHSNSQALADAIQYLASDAKLRSEMGAIGSQKFRDLYHVDVMVRRYAALYLQAAGRATDCATHSEAGAT